MRSFSQKTLSILICIYKMENMRMPELKALARERGLRNYSRLRKADLAVLLQDNESRTQSRQQSAPTRPMCRTPKVSEIRPGQSKDPN